MDITTSTPAQIDGAIAAKQARIARAGQVALRSAALIEEFDAANEYERTYSWLSAEKIAAARAVVAASIEEKTALEAEIALLTAEFDARGGWTRFFLVTNSGGHVHWTTGCDTCFPTTQFAWLTDYSGKTHAEFVEFAGSKACTICFPDAPVDVLRRKSTIETTEAKARREERAAKAAEKVAAEVVVKEYIEWGRQKDAKTFKSVRAVTNDIASNLTSLCCWGTDHPSSAEWSNNVAKSLFALRERGEEYDYEKALAAARKRTVREGCEPRF